MNFSLATFGKYASLALYVAAGVEKVAADNASGADKKTMALDALQVAMAGAQSVAPGQTQAINAFGQLASQLIEAAVSFANTSGLFAHKSKLQDSRRAQNVSG